MTFISWVGARKKLAAISSAAVLLIAGGAGTYAFINLPPNPQANLNKAIVNTYKAESAAMRMTMEYKTKRGFAMTIRVLGASTLLSGHYQAVLSIDTGLVDINFSGELFQGDDGDIYVKLGKNPALAPFLQGATGISEEDIANVIAEMDNKWVRVSRFDVTENKEVLAAWNCVLAYSQGRIFKEDEAPLLELLARHPYAKATKELAGETVLGEPSRHYAVELDYTQEKPLYEAAGALKSFEPVATECKDVNLPGTISGSADMPQAFSNESTEVWIGKGNGQITKLVTKNSAQDYSVILTAEAVYKPVSLNAPTDFILFERIRELFVPGSLGNEYDFTPEAEDGHLDHTH